MLTFRRAIKQIARLCLCTKTHKEYITYLSTLIAETQQKSLIGKKKTDKKGCEVPQYLGDLLDGMDSKSHENLK